MATSVTASAAFSSARVWPPPPNVPSSNFAPARGANSSNVSLNKTGTWPLIAAGIKASSTEEHIYTIL